jgi:hypothetical protein
MRSTSARLADINAAVIAIDSPEHGSRAADPKTDPLLASFSFFGIDPVTQSFYIGHSFGSVQGPAIFATAPSAASSP